MSLTSEAARSRSHRGSTLVTGDDNKAVLFWFFFFFQTREAARGPAVTHTKVTIHLLWSEGNKRLGGSGGLRQN